VARKKFPTEKWAETFLNACSANGITDKDVEKAYLCLKALSEPVKSLPPIFFGHSASDELEKIMRDCAGDAINDPAVEYAIRFICLLVERKSFRFVNSLLGRIEQKLDEQKGILSVTIETASPMEKDFEKELVKMIKEKTGATGVKMAKRVRPDLLGGYMLRIGAFYVDATLKGQLETIRTDLINAATAQQATAQQAASQPMAGEQ
jgi:ATP synthase F1 delta subunit